jgi:nucleotide-binding universal stress UspA family protein
MSFFSNQTIVVPYDFSEDAKRAVDRANEIGDATTKVHILHVVEPTPVAVSIDPTLPVPPTFDQERLNQAKIVLAETFGTSLEQQPILECLFGDPGHEIVEYAKSVDADLILMPSHGRTGLSRLFLGSVAERVLRLAHRPVLILRDDSQKET